ncbi:MAG: MBL fold metallo-hydrolase [SAR202 cluster bacterium]|nr:MBL fold metallo-hydrolase [SAR202 cluster bacterium]MDP6514422.1 MBL fold metallo-hydrolase [SAR202 cluster bacterium]MDP6715027.1 MBL fold metallo-hydrolase [SAR202 cluster bacterium]
MEILPGIHALPGINWSKAYLIEGDTLALVDSGLPWNSGRILKYIRKIGRKPEELSHLLVTHAHPDHTGSASSVARKTGAQVVAHSADTKRRRNGANLSYMGVFGSAPIPLPFFERTPVATLVNEGDVLPIAGGIRILHTPGHTSGSVCFLEESTKTLFSGDTIFSDGERISRSVPFPGYDAVAYRASLERLATLDFEAVCGGHGAPLKSGGSGKLQELMEARPELPTWRQFFRSIPRRVKKSRSMTGEDF